jgi:hypothetical protein
MTGSLIRAEAAFLAPPADPFAEYHRMSAAFDRDAERLAQDHAAFRQRLNDACQVRETSR